MTTLLEKLKGSQALQAYWDLRTGSLLDLSGNPVPNPLTPVAAVTAPTWDRSSSGRCIQSAYDGTATGLTTTGNPASLQLSTLTFFAVAKRNLSNGAAAYQTIMQKQLAWSLFFNAGAEPKSFGSYDWGGGAPRASTFTAQPDGRIHLFAVSSVSGLAGGTAFYVDGVARGTAQVTVSSQANDWRIAGGVAGQALWGGVLLAGIVNRLLSPAEHARLFNEWMESGFVTDVSTRMFFGPWQQGMSDDEYARQGIVLDTDLVRQPNGQTRDMVGSYPGTITNILVPGPDGSGGTFAASTQVTHAAVLPISQAPACSIVMDTRNPASFTAGRYVLQASNGVADSLYWLMIPGGALWPRVQLTVGGVAAYGEPAANVLRAGVRQHVVSVFNGVGATNADRLKIYVDGEQQALNFSGNIPALMPTLTASFAQGLNPISHSHTCHQLQVRTTAMSAANVRDEYVRWAQNVDWQAAGEDVPVSLVASVASPQHIGSWRVVDGTWKVSEDSAGKRWLECVTAGTILIPAPTLLMFGTHTFTVVKAQAPTSTRLAFLTMGDSVIGGGVAGQNGYCTVLDDNLAVRVSRVTNGIIPANVFITGNNFVALATPYTFAVARRPSDCRFSQWIKGGAYPDFRATAGPGTEASYFTCSWLHFQGGAGDKLLINDPSRPGACLRHFRGQLNPTLNEVPT